MPAGGAVGTDGGRDDSAGVELSFGWSVVRTPALAALLLLVVLGVAEWAVRLPAVREPLLHPSVGARIREFDLQLMRLADHAAAGPLDYLVLGASVVSSGVDPRALEAAHRARSGQALRGYAFGIPALTTEAAAVLASIVVDAHQPSLLVYAFTARAFQAPGAKRQRDPTLEVPWVRYRMGERSFEGWLVEHSAAYRQLLPYRHLLKARAWEQLLVHERRPHVAGFTPNDRIAPPDPQPGRVPDHALLGVVEAPTPPQPDLASLAALVRVRQQGVDVVLLEMPIHPQTSAFFRYAERDLTTVRARVREFADARDIPFWPATEPGLIPEHGWSDIGHLNTTGAAAFSAWLGERLATEPRLGRSPTDP